MSFDSLIVFRILFITTLIIQRSSSKCCVALVHSADPPLT
jgi:hypothetical protein